MKKARRKTHSVATKGALGPRVGWEVARRSSCRGGLGQDQLETAPDLIVVLPFPRGARAWLRAFSKIRNEKVARAVGFNVWKRCFGMERRGVLAERAPKRRLDHALEPHSRGKLGKPRKCVVFGCFGFRQRRRGGKGVFGEVFGSETVAKERF